MFRRLPSLVLCHLELFGAVLPLTLARCTHKNGDGHPRSKLYKGWRQAQWRGACCQIAPLPQSRERRTLSGPNLMDSLVPGPGSCPSAEFSSLCRSRPTHLHLHSR